MKRIFLLDEVARARGASVEVPVNTVAPSVIGTRRVGQTLTVSDGAWTGSPTSYAYQWLRYGAAISGATNNTYVLTSSDADKAITCRVTATNAGGSTAAYSAYDERCVPRTYDWSGYSNTTTGTAGVVGTTSAGVEGWTPLKSGGWRITSGKAHADFGTTNRFTDLLYLGTRLRLNDRIAFQGSNQSSPLYYSGGVGLNITTGEGYLVQWVQGGSSFTVWRMLASDSTYPAETTIGMKSLNGLSYGGGASDDWCVVQRTVQAETSTITVMICPNSSGVPDYANPRVTYTTIDTYSPLAVPGYAFVSSCVSSFEPQMPRFEVTSHSFDFTTSSVRYGLSSNVDITLTGNNTLWASGDTFTVSAGASLNSVTYTSATSVTLHCTTGADLADITITDPNGITNRVYVRTNASAETRQVYYVRRLVDTRKTPAGNGAGEAVFAAVSSYGVGFSLDGQYVYILNGTNALKYNLAGTLQATITASAARKMLTLPDGSYIINNWGGDYRLFSSSDVDQGVWNDVAVTNPAGLTVLYDQALGRNTILTTHFSSGNARQWEMDGAFIKIWASPGGALTDVVVDSTGYVYISDWTETPTPAPRILRYTNAGVYVSAITTALSQPFDLAILSDDTILAACEFGAYAGRVLGFTPLGIALGDWQAAGGAATGIGVIPV